MTLGYPSPTGDASTPEPASVPAPDPTAGPGPGPSPASLPPASVPPAGWPAPPQSAPPLAAPPVPYPPPGAVPQAYPYGPPGYPYPYPYPPVQPVTPPRRHTGLIIGIVAGVVVLLLAGTAAVAIVALRTAGGSPQAAAQGPSPGATKAPTPVGPEEYQKALDAVDQEVQPLYAAMTVTKHPDDLQSAAFALARAIDARVSTLGAVGPPAAVAAAHAHLVAGLVEFQAAVTAVASTSLGEVCAGPSALSFVSRSTGADRLRSAIAELATADTAHAYKVGAFVPPTTPDPTRSLDNGATIKSSKASSPNRLTIKNPTDLDVVSSLAPTGTKTALAIFYAKAGQDATYIGIPDGDYDLFFTRGADWDNASVAFTRKCAYDEVTKTFDFASTSTTYRVWTVTVTADAPWKKTSAEFPL